MSRGLTDDHEAHDHCGCCGQCYVYLNGSFCLPCRTKKGHLGSPGLPPWERTYFAVHGEPCPLHIDGFVSHSEGGTSKQTDGAT